MNCPYINDEGHVAQRCPHCAVEERSTDKWENIPAPRTAAKLRELNAAVGFSPQALLCDMAAFAGDLERELALRSSGSAAAWRCEDLILKGVVSFTDDAELAVMRQSRPDCWKVEPLYPSSYERCFDAAFKALERLDSVRFMWNGPIHQAAALLREATGPQSAVPSAMSAPPADPEADALQRDAARYRWLRHTTSLRREMGARFLDFDIWIQVPDDNADNAMDVAIDAAMAADQTQYVEQKK